MTSIPLRLECSVLRAFPLFYRSSNGSWISDGGDGLRWSQPPHQTTPKGDVEAALLALDKINGLQHQLSQQTSLAALSEPNLPPHGVFPEMSRIVEGDNILNYIGVQAAFALGVSLCLGFLYWDWWARRLFDQLLIPAGAGKARRLLYFLCPSLRESGMGWGDLFRRLTCRRRRAEADPEVGAHELGPIPPQVAELQVVEIAEPGQRPPTTPPPRRALGSPGPFGVAMAALRTYARANAQLEARTVRDVARGRTLSASGN